MVVFFGGGGVGGDCVGVSGCHTVLSHPPHCKVHVPAGAACHGCVICWGIVAWFLEFQVCFFLDLFIFF